MLDIKFVRDNPEAVKENIRKKFQNAKLPLVDEVIALDAEKRAAMNEANDLRAQRNQLSKRVGMLMGQAKKDPSKLAEAEEAKAQVKANADRLAQLEEMLQAEGPIGRKLDFLIQEFNREANTGLNYELDAIAACVIGGVSFVGGTGKISGIVLGVFVLRIIFVALSMLGIDPSMQYIIKGGIILAACSLDMRKYLAKK